MSNHQRQLWCRCRRSRVIVVIIVLTILVIPPLWKIGRMKQAMDNYDVLGLRSELNSPGVFGKFLFSLGFVQDAKLWLALNLNNQDIIAQLSRYNDDKHLFWLFLYDLQQGNNVEAENIMTRIGNPTQKDLAQSVWELAKGNFEGTQVLLSERTRDWSAIPRQERVLRHLALAQASLNRDDFVTAHEELTVVRNLQPFNPAVQSIEFNLALQEEQWSRAYEAGKSIQNQTWRAETTLFETEMALLALRVNHQEGFAKSLYALKRLPHGEAVVNYLKGIQALGQGRTQEGHNFLKIALQGDLEGSVKADALQALQQATKRQEVDPLLKSLTRESQ
ncbi:hypothetical protein ACPUYX_12695 [Desulfosporosinus sp. SYSU MS00001]|uniref:hypothetical protein n=1 Tax=Desulfosporosinus sp. SYSU MS00001 TaxID=3416284 RepID=UPI003CEC1ADB